MHWSLPLFLLFAFALIVLHVSAAQCNERCVCTDDRGRVWDFSGLMNREFFSIKPDFNYSLRLCGVTSISPCASKGMAICQYDKTTAYGLGKFTATQPMVTQAANGPRFQFTNGDPCSEFGIDRDRVVDVYLRMDLPMTGTFDVSSVSSECTYVITVPAKGADITPLEPEVAVEGIVEQNLWKYYSIDVDWQWGELLVRFEAKSGIPALYLRYGEVPTQDTYDYVDTSLQHQRTIELREKEGEVRLKSGTYYLGVYGLNGAAEFELSVAFNICPGNCSGQQGVCNRDTRECSCAQGYIGSDCSIQWFDVDNAIPLKLSLAPGQAVGARFEVTEPAISVEAFVTRLMGDSPLSLAASRNVWPTADYALSRDVDNEGKYQLHFVSAAPAGQVLSGSVWYFFIKNEAGGPVGIEFTAVSHVCPNDCSYHGHCDEERHTCTCEEPFTKAEDCSVGMGQIAFGEPQVVMVVGRTQMNYRIAIPDQALAAKADLVINATVLHSDPLLPRVRVRPGTPPSPSEPPFAVATETYQRRLAVTHEDIAALGPIWYVQIDQPYADPATVTLTVTLSAHCAHGTPTQTGTCVCDQGWKGPMCSDYDGKSDDGNKRVSALAAALIGVGTFVLGFVLALLVKRCFPGLCQKKFAPLDESVPYTNLSS